MTMTFRQDLLRGRAALVTGGGTGIGRGIALALAEHGCDVAITSRRPAHLEPTVRELEASGVRAVALPADVRDPAAMVEVVDGTVAALGRLDILVNGAAGNFLCRAEDLAPQAFGTVVDIDLKGTFHASRAAFPHLRATRGLIINISATAHFGGTPAQLHASAAKAGVDAVTRTLAVEWGEHGIRVNGIAPGPVGDTEGARRLFAGSAGDVLAARTPLGRLGTIEDVAGAALFLCSPAALFISGVTLVVDGGLVLANALSDRNQRAPEVVTHEG
jgi:2,4-dienoyl-CoA reductase [(3E)-enoyl-CoA-producing], peroxisomal